MSTFAAVMTAKGTGPIATVQLYGTTAEKILKKIFIPAGRKSANFEPGRICLGSITSGKENIDQVTIGCEGSKCFAINCHGNPLIVADIMRLLGRHSVILLTAKQLLCKTLSAQKNLNTIEIEAKLTHPKAKTLDGTKIIVNQIETDTGLNSTTKMWLQNINETPLKEIKSVAEQIIKKSQIAKPIIAGCKIILTGPPNTGKSTLLNCLAGRQKAIVTDIKGTTRDYVTANCRIKPLYVELVDTAGLDEQFATAPDSTINKIAQQKAVLLIDEADLLLLVLDSSETNDQLDKSSFDKISGKKILTVLNKSDLPAKLNTGKLPKLLTNTVNISAKNGTGMENLRTKVRRLLAINGFNLTQPICFTARQTDLLQKLTKAKSKSQAASIITELLNGRLRV